MDNNDPAVNDPAVNDGNDVDDNEDDSDGDKRDGPLGEPSESSDKPPSYNDEGQ